MRAKRRCSPVLKNSLTDELWLNCVCHAVCHGSCFELHFRVKCSLLFGPCVSINNNNTIVHWRECQFTKLIKSKILVRCSIYIGLSYTLLNTSSFHFSIYVCVPVFIDRYVLGLLFVMGNESVVSSSFVLASFVLFYLNHKSLVVRAQRQSCHGNAIDLDLSWIRPRCQSTHMWICFVFAEHSAVLLLWRVFTLLLYLPCVCARVCDSCLVKDLQFIRTSILE